MFGRTVVNWYHMFNTKSTFTQYQMLWEPLSNSLIQIINTDISALKYHRMLILVLSLQPNLNRPRPFHALVNGMELNLNVSSLYRHDVKQLSWTYQNCVFLRIVIKTYWPEIHAFDMQMNNLSHHGSCCMLHWTISFVVVQWVNNGNQRSLRMMDINSSMHWLNKYPWSNFHTS